MTWQNPRASIKILHSTIDELLSGRSADGQLVLWSAPAIQAPTICKWGTPQVAMDQLKAKRLITVLITVVTLSVGIVGMVDPRAGTLFQQLLPVLILVLTAYFATRQQK
jgi:hypothetical protein